MTQEWRKHTDLPWNGLEQKDSAYQRRQPQTEVNAGSRRQLWRLQHLTAATACRPDHDPSQSQAPWWVKSFIQRAREPSVCHRRERSSQKTDEPNAASAGFLWKTLWTAWSLLLWEKAPVSSVVRKSSPTISIIRVYSHRHGHVVTLAYRRAHSLKPRLSPQAWALICSPFQQERRHFKTSDTHAEFQGECYLIQEAISYFYGLRQ